MKTSSRFIRTAIVYLRTHNIERNMSSMEEQKITVQNYIKKNNYRILRTFEESNVSGKSLDRKELENMLEYIRANKRKVKFLIVDSIDRLSRSVDGVKKIKYFMKHHGIQIISIRDSLARDITKVLKKHF